MITALAALTLLGVAVAVVALIALHIVPSGLSPLRDPVSAYGISRWRALYRTQTLATAVAAVALAGALLAGGIPSALAALIALAALALTRGPISWVPMDAADAPRTATGRRHNLLAFGAFAAASVGGFMTGIAFSAAGIDGAANASTLLGWVMTAASAVTILASVVRPLKPVFGLAERLIYVGMFAWLSVAAVALLTS
ncbi:DUF998 domain-containing protein [Microbacterium sp. NPDC090225]|uniref:DUF998 domain-containing protein n=1 Tax=Microbacterium sp. NPDC090225 TaxID=3364207 RepID=UPI0038281ECA